MPLYIAKGLFVPINFHFACRYFFPEKNCKSFDSLKQILLEEVFSEARGLVFKKVFGGILEFLGSYGPEHKRQKMWGKWVASIHLDFSAC